MNVENLKIMICEKNFNVYIHHFEIKNSVYNFPILNITFHILRKDIMFFKSLIYKDNSSIDVSIKNNLFKGIIKTLEIIDNNEEEYVITINAVTNIFELTKKKNIRFFQDTSITYSQLIDNVMNKYKIQYTISEKLKSKKIDKIFLQYLENDFEFLKRVLNNEKEYIYVINSNILSFGEYKSNSKKIEYLSKKIYRENNNVFTEYITVLENIEIGDKIDDEIIIENNVYKEKDNIFRKIKTVNKGKYNFCEIYNEKIIGFRMEAQVVEVFNDLDIAKMTVSIKNTIEKINGIFVEEKNKTKFSYQTFYSKTNTGLFCTPEKDDIVEIYFPNNDENYARISWSINNEKSGRFSLKPRNYNLNEKIFLILNEEKFELKLNDISMNFNNFYAISNNFTVSTNQTYSNLSKGTISIENKNMLNIYSNDIKLKSTKGDISIISTKNVNIKGNKVFNG